VEKPNKDAMDKELADLTAQVEALKDERVKLQEKIDAHMDTAGDSEISQKRYAAQELRAKKGALINEKKAIRAKLDALKDQGDRLVKDRKDTRANVRFGSVQEIDAELQKLQRRQETTSMSLGDEKRLIKEMDALRASKKLVADLKTKETSLEGVKEQRKAISEQISAKDKEIDAVQKEIEELSEVIKSMSEKQNDKKDGTRALFSERDELRKKINDKLKEKDAVRAQFREKNDAWFSYQRAVRAQKQIQFEEEKKRRAEEKAEWEKKKMEEEEKKVPYEEEMALCDYLADYLTRTYLGEGGNEKHAVEKKDEVVAVKEDPFAGKKPVGKMVEDEEDYFGKGKGKKKRNRNKQDKKTAGPFTLNVDTFEQFGLLNLNPPTSVDQVQKSVDDLRAKKEWFSKQPRGSVPTATEIRKANERSAMKLKSKTVETSSPSKPKKDANFSLEDFAPLGAGTASASINATWGQKVEEAPAVSDPQEAA
jgi:uncharacterized coiled-coil DUF342 family protein